MGRSSASIMLCVTVVVLSGFGQMVICNGEDGDNFIKMKLGSLRDFDVANRWNKAEIEALARFAVQEHNRRANAFLELARVLKAKEQVVAGKLYHLTLEVIEAETKKTYEAKVWVKPWMNFKQLQEFKHVINDVVSSTSSDIGSKLDGYGFEWITVPTDDPDVKDAANHAVKSIQQRSNSLQPYKLLEIMLAKAKNLGEHVKYEMLLKLERGNKLEKLMVEVMKNNDGKFY